MYGLNGNSIWDGGMGTAKSSLISSGSRKKFDASREKKAAKKHTGPVKHMKMVDGKLRVVKITEV